MSATPQTLEPSAWAMEAAKEIVDFANNSKSVNAEQLVTIILRHAPPSGDVTKLREALELVLLFHACDWDDEQKERWANLLTSILGPAIQRDCKIVGANGDGTWDGNAWKDNAATTKNLCVAVRAALASVPAPARASVDVISKLRGCIGFFASCIKSDEQWSDRCEQELRECMDAIAAAESAQPVERRSLVQRCQSIRSRTDEQEKVSINGGVGAWVTADFARQLERELATERTAREKAESQSRDMRSTYGFGAQVMNQVIIPANNYYEADGLPLNFLKSLQARAESAEAKLQAQSMADELAGALKTSLVLAETGDHEWSMVNDALRKAREVLARFDAANKPYEK